MMMMDRVLWCRWGMWRGKEGRDGRSRKAAEIPEERRDEGEVLARQIASARWQGGGRLERAEGTEHAARVAEWQSSGSQRGAKLDTGGREKTGGMGGSSR